MSNGDISNNRTSDANRPGGVNIEGTGNFTMTGGRIGGEWSWLLGSVNWNEGPAGGGIRINRNATITLASGSIVNNRATNGGAIYVANGFLVLSGTADTQNITISNNTATADGGGVWVAENATLTTRSGTNFSNNHASWGNQTNYGMGGAIFTQRHQYAPTLDMTATPAPYSNLTIAEGTIFADNTAYASYQPPTNADETNISGDSYSINGHPLNNFDINFRRNNDSGNNTTFTFTKTDLSSPLDNDPGDGIGDFSANLNDYTPWEAFGITQASTGRAYNYNPLPGARFQLYRWDDEAGEDEDGDWVPVGSFVECDGYGRISFTLTPGGHYSFTETQAPDGFARPTGRWVIERDADGNVTDITSEGGNPNFYECEDGYWYLGNSKAPDGVDFIFHKVDNNNNPLPDAQFTLVRYNGPGTPQEVMVTPDMLTGETPAWTYVVSRTSGELTSQAMIFNMIPGRYYQLIETAAPSGFQMPMGEWRIRVPITANDDEPILVITHIGGVNMPGITRVGAYTYNIANWPEIRLPHTGGLGGGTMQMIMYAGLFICILTLGAVAYLKLKPAKVSNTKTQPISNYNRRKL